MSIFLMFTICLFVILFSLLKVPDFWSIFTLGCLLFIWLIHRKFLSIQITKSFALLHVEVFFFHFRTCLYFINTLLMLLFEWTKTFHFSQIYHFLPLWSMLSESHLRRSFLPRDHSDIFQYFFQMFYSFAFNI